MINTGNYRFRSLFFLMLYLTIAKQMNNIIINIRKVQQTIKQIADDCGRNADEICLLAVSKKKPVCDIQAAFDAGQQHFGENYCQEAEQKITALKHLDIIWHFIGPIQSNKTRQISQLFDWVHTVDRLKIAKRLNSQRSAELSPLNICLQVNIEQEASKSGIHSDEMLPLADEISKLQNLNLRGLMAIPSIQQDEQLQRKPFAQLRELLTQLQQQHPQCDTLSMGMSNDMNSAIAEGATVVRIGTAIFGERLK